ncbi:hypothetical protein EVAR_73014_1 [Eumeta japonica]|uniref:Uncharacterized protein n=1 Tax=Eumeta variegata TaxID=151549 RepID=A0A4C2AGY2_EUMVA|nr:hypothetical protein EVAR_73014_1 [Eumeta japonica]
MVPEVEDRSKPRQISSHTIQDGDDIRVSVFAHAAPKALHRLQVIQNKFCRAATDAHWCVRNGLRTPTISKYMKDASKRFFDIAGSHPNALLRAAVDYQPPHPTHLIRRSRNILTDPPDALTAAVEILNDINNTHD